LTASSKTRPTAGQELDTEVREVLTLLGTVMKEMKRHSGKPAHEGASAAFESGALGDRHVAPLLALAMEGEMSVSQLAERLGLTLGTTSMLVGELTTQGLTERREDEEDRRRTIVSLTPDLQDDVAPWINETLDPIRRGLERMGRSKRTAFLDGLRILGEEAGNDDAPPC
jgi:DNA-binding MarR family transcriptional regulator